MRRRRRLAVNPISIHALREEGDYTTTKAGVLNGCISIHALREEGDSGQTSITSVC